MVVKESMRATLVKMKAGECIRIAKGTRLPSSIRNCASVLGTDLGRKYSVAAKPDAYEVTRIR